jgi:thymidylate synthase (FAD)
MESLAPEHVAHKWLLDKGEVALLGFFGDDKMIADTARVSYRKGTKQTSTDKQLIRYLVRNRHTSPIEHATLRFYVKAPLFVIQQLLRHRTFKFNQASARYSEMLNEAYVPLPEHVTTQDAKNKQARTDTKLANAQSIVSQIEDGQEWAFKDYGSFLNQGVARELARINVPHGTYSELIMTCDLHNLLHFLALRLNPHAQYEIRVFAEAILDMIKGLFPAVVEAWEDCVLNSFTITSQMADALAYTVSHLITGPTYDTHDEAIHAAIARAAAMTEWPSNSEKDQFLAWAALKLRVQRNTTEG